MRKLILALMLLALVGCNSSSDNNDLTTTDVTAQINAAVAPLQQQITALQAQVAKQSGGNTVVFGAPTSSARTSRILLPTEIPAQATATVAAGSFLGPFNAIIGMTVLANQSTSGYLYCSPGGPGNHSACLLATVLFESNNCTGAGFIIPNTPLSSLNVAGGAVIGIGADGDTTATDYYMLPPNPSTQADFANSEVEVGGACTVISPGPNNFTAVWELQANDPNVTKIPSGVIGTNPTIAQ